MRVNWVFARPSGRHVGGSMLLLCVALATTGCRGESSPAVEASAAVAFVPDPPVVGVAELNVTLSDADGNPLSLGRLEVEGNMDHAGMTPVFTTLEESDDPGVYEGTLKLTMAGDWFLILSGELPGGGRVEEQVDVPGVKPK